MIDRPTRAELTEHCPECGEQLDYGREECVTLSCSEYLSVTNSLERESVLAHARDTREWFDDENPALPGKRVA